MTDEVRLNTMIFEFDGEGSAIIKHMFISPNVVATQILGLTGFLEVLAKAQIMAMQENQNNATIEDETNPKILRVKP